MQLFWYFEVGGGVVVQVSACKCIECSFISDSTMLGGPYCGESLHGRTFVTSGNSLRLEFTTDVSFALRGFKAKITFVPSTGKVSYFAC